MSDKPKNVSTEVVEGKFGYKTDFMCRKFGFKAEIHRDDGSWSYGLGKSKAGAIDDANRHLDRDDPLHDWSIDIYDV